MATTLTAIDLGASNGRIMTAHLQDGLRLKIQEAHRFEHSASMRAGRLRWDWTHIKAEIQRGLARLPATSSISCSSWAQDFALLDRAGNLLSDPVSYFDQRTHGMPESFRDVIAPEDLVRRAGVASTNITTLCQLRAMSQQEPETLAKAECLLHIANLVHYDLCGVAATDWTMASAAQICNRLSGRWDLDLLNLLGIPTTILPELMPAPTILSRIPPARAPAPAWVDVPVVLTAGHDTPSAFFVLPESESDTLFLSCGTWVMMGTRLPGATMSGIESSGTLLGLARGGWGLWRGSLGLWALQQCSRAWRALGEMWAPADLAIAAQQSDCQSLLDLSDPSLTDTADVPAAIQKLCRAAGQAEPLLPGDIARVIYRSLAVACRDNARIIARSVNRPLRRLRVVGGGSRNAWFCQLLANTCGLPVDAGPHEATVAGNLLLQLQAMGIAEDQGRLDAIRQSSFPIKTFTPA